MNTHAEIRTKLISDCVCIIVHAYLFMQDLSRFGSPVWITNHVQKFQSSFVIVPINQSCTPSPVAHQYVLLCKHYLNSSFKLYFYTLTHDEYSLSLSGGTTYRDPAVFLVEVVQRREFCTVPKGWREELETGIWWWENLLVSLCPDLQRQWSVILKNVQPGKPPQTVHTSFLLNI